MIPLTVAVLRTRSQLQSHRRLSAQLLSSLTSVTSSSSVGGSGAGNSILTNNNLAMASIWSNHHLRKASTTATSTNSSSNCDRDQEHGGPSIPSTSTTITIPSPQSGKYKPAAGRAGALGSALGTDCSMIASNHRHTLCPTTNTTTSMQIRCMSKMKDEYGAMDDSGHTYEYSGTYVLESGQTLQHPQLRYQTYGKLNAAADNVLVVCHALTGNASLHAWWGDLLGPGRAFDTTKYLVVCCNILGSCYGSTSPASIDPATKQRYGTDFPDVSVKDTVRLQLLLLQQELGVKSVKAVIGGSFGGMQAVEFAVQAGSANADFTDAAGNPYCRTVIPIACGAQHTAWQIAVSQVQRQAIYYDPAWQSDDPFGATAGLQVARQLGMVSYRTPMGYSSKFGRQLKTGDSPPYGSNAKWQVKSYLEYQGRKFLGRFDPVTYVKMTEQMDSHDVARGRGGSIPQVLGSVEIPALVMGIDSDVLYPLAEQEELAELLPAGRLQVIHSDDGHDGFLLEQDQVAAHIVDFLNQHD